mgnify:FL=1
MIIFIYMDNKLNTRQDKVNFIIGVFKFYQPTLNIPEQIALLTLWESSCVLAEEYEMALAVIDEMKKIQENPTKMPQKTIELKEDFGESNEGLIFVKKNNNKPFYKKLFYWFKNLFKRN